MLRLARHSLLLAAITALAATGQGCTDDGPTTEELREDLNLLRYDLRIENGLSERVKIEVPEGVGSILIEAEGKRGAYSIAEFITPQGRDLIEGAGAPYQQRGAREIPGLADWLFPNSGDLSLEEKGTYTLSLKEEQRITENVELRVYLTDKKPKETCGIHLDFLLDEVAIDESVFQDAVDYIVEEVDERFRQVGIKVVDYTTSTVNMQDPDINLGNGSATRIVDEVLDRSRLRGAARPDAIHILFVRRIGGSDNPTFDPAGYSMGLPGPYSVDRATSAVLVSTELYARQGDLDGEGLASSLTHELGHYMGLYHTSEKGGVAHDPIADTPQCDGVRCGDEFLKNIMTSAFWLGGKEPATRVLFSEDQGKVLRNHPLCLPMDVQIVKPKPECTKRCPSPDTCAILKGEMSCEPKCSANEPGSCSDGTSCFPDDLGNYVCQAD